MADISAHIRLRPTRIGFLVRPNDLTSVRKIMRLSCCLWGGIYNPIIPVFRTSPKEWKRNTLGTHKGAEITKGYIKFFEPDVYVEAEEGLLEEAGLGELSSKNNFSRQITRSLSKFLTAENGKEWSEPRFGLTVMDVLRNLYQSERQFQPRDKRHAVYVQQNRDAGAAAEAIFGVYPSQKDASYFLKGFKDVFQPKVMSAGPKAWLEVFKKGAHFPLRTTRHKLELSRRWHDELVIFIFDPKKSTDLIDLWNIRLESNPILPVPVDWFAALSEELKRAVAIQYKPIAGTPQNLMQRTIIEYARSIPQKISEQITSTFVKNLPTDSVGFKLWRTRVWEGQMKHGPIIRRMNVTAEEKRTKIEIIERDGHFSGEFETISPAFASRFGGQDSRWANVVRLSTLGVEKVGTLYPLNTFDKEWPPLTLSGTERVSVSSEGLVFSQTHKGWDQYVTLESQENTIISFLQKLGIKGKLSDPGYIAKQMFEHLGGWWGLHLINDAETLKLLNKMAGGLRRKSNSQDTIEETFERRTAPLKDWSDLVARRSQSRRPISIEEFTRRNVIRIGLETDCPHCRFVNWHSIATATYSLTCERCLNIYDFPQGGMREHNRNWHYRVVGPFSVPDFARGAYASLLALRFLQNFSLRANVNFAPAIELKWSSVDAEIDFIALRGGDDISSEEEPRLVIGETKSFGSGELITSRDLARLKIVGEKIPGAVILVSVLREDFTSKEKSILTPFVKWGRRPDKEGKPTNPVVLLTGRELFFDHLLGPTWKSFGGRYEEFSDYEHTEDLDAVADATQQIQLNLPSVSTQRRKEWERREKNRKRISH